MTILSCTNKLPLTSDLASWYSAVLLLAICSAVVSRYGDNKVGALSPTQKHPYTSCDNRKKARARWTILLPFWRHKRLWRLEHCTSVSSMCSKVISYSHQATMILYSKERRKHGVPLWSNISTTNNLYSKHLRRHTREGWRKVCNSSLRNKNHSAFTKKAKSCTFGTPFVYSFYELFAIHPEATLSRCNYNTKF